MRPIVGVLFAASIVAADRPNASPLLRAQEVEDTRIIQGPVPPPVVRDSLPAPRATVGTAVVAGTVVSSDAGRPVRRATVRLAGSLAGPPPTTQADEQGRFTFVNVPAGRFTLTVSKPGYLDSIYGQRRPGSGRPGTPISVTDGQRVERLSVPLARGGVLAGTVTDDGGEPAYGTDVRAYRHVWTSGERTLRVEGTARADDRGQYRIGALPPGDYIVMATPPGGPGPVFFERAGGNVAAVRIESPLAGMASPAPISAEMSDRDMDSYAPVFFPGALSSQNAAVISLDIGEERSGLDVQMPFVATGTITGIVLGEGRPTSGVQVQLQNADETLALTARMAITAPDGSFTFTALPPGRYRVNARTGPQRKVQIDEVNGQTRVMMQFMNAAPPGPDGGLPPDGAPAGFAGTQRQQWASADISVAGRDTQHVMLSLETGITLSGRVQFDGSGPVPSNLNSITVVLTPTGAAASDGASALARVGPDGRFTIPDVVPGRYRPAILAGGTWRARQFEIQGRDALDTLLDVEAGHALPEATVTLTTRLASVTGVLTDAAGQPASDYTIILFSEDPAFWTPRSRRTVATRPATDGRFALADLPAGRYRMAAVEDIEDGQWFNPTLLTQLAGSAIAVDVAEGGIYTQDIRLAR